jgi:hypothetical protein
MVTIETDDVLRRLLDTGNRPETPMFQVLEQFRETGSRSFSHMTEAIVDAGLAEDFAAVLAAHIPLDEPTVLVEGYGLRGDVLASLVRRLEDKAMVWTTERLSADEASSQLPREQAETIELLRWKLAQAEAVKRLPGETPTPTPADPDRQSDSLRHERDEALRERDALQAQLGRITSRRSVRAALKVAGLVRPIARRLRR